MVRSQGFFLLLQRQHSGWQHAVGREQEQDGEDGFEGLLGEAMVHFLPDPGSEEASGEDGESEPEEHGALP